MPERWVATPDGAQLFVNEIGPAEGPPVVVLHGGPAAHHDYLLPAFARLADPWRLIFYDQRGGGRSRDAADVPLGIDAHLDDIRAVIESTGQARVHLVGYSFGGLLAMIFAARHPARIDRLALCSSAPPQHGYRPGLQRALADAQASSWVVAERQALETSGLRTSLPDEYRRRRFALSVAGYFADPRLAYGLTPFRVQARVAAILEDSLGQYDVLDEVARLDGDKLLILHGDSDPIAASTLAPLAARTGARMELIAGVGHVPYLEAPDLFFSIMRRFLGDLR